MAHTRLALAQLSRGRRRSLCRPTRLTPGPRSLPPWLRLGLAALVVAGAAAAGWSQAPGLPAAPQAVKAPDVPSTAGLAASADAQRRLRRWGDGQRLELLPFRQSSTEPADRSRLDLLLPSGTLPPGVNALQIALPDPLRDGPALAWRLRLCRLASPASERRVRCLESWPIAVEPLPSGLRIQPLRPLESGGPYALSATIRNSLREGFHPVRLYAISPELPGPVYLGTWLLEILSRAE